MNYINGKPIEHFYLEKDGITWTEKSPLMKLEDGLITKEEYNKIVDTQRQVQYKNKTDNLLLDFMSSYFEARKDTLTEAELKIWKDFETKKQEIKTQYQKQN